MKIRNLRM